MRPKTVIFVVLVAALINLPLLHGLYLDQRLDGKGVEVTGQVTESSATDAFRVAFTVPGTEGRTEFSGAAEVDEETYEEAVRTGEVTVTVLPETPGVWRVEGQVTNRTGLVITLLADLFLAIMVFLLVRFRSRLKPVIVLLATEDLERCPPGSVLDRLEDDRYVVAGDIVRIEEDELLLDLGDRRVRIVLDGHHNPAGYDQPVMVTGRMIG